MTVTLINAFFTDARSNLCFIDLIIQIFYRLRIQQENKHSTALTYESKLSLDSTFRSIVRRGDSGNTSAVTLIPAIMQSCYNRLSDDDRPMVFQ